MALVAVSEEIIRFGMLLLLFGSVFLVGAILGDTETRYDLYTVDEALESRPIGREVRVEGNVTDFIGVSNRSGIRYVRFALGDEKRLLVYCSLFNKEKNVSVGERVVVEGEFKSYQHVLEVATQCFRVRDKG